MYFLVVNKERWHDSMPCSWDETILSCYNVCCACVEAKKLEVKSLEAEAVSELFENYPLLKIFHSTVLSDHSTVSGGATDDSIH